MPSGPTPAGDDSQLLDVKQVAELLSVSVKTVQRMRDRGELPKGIRVSVRAVRWRRRDIERFVARL